MGVVVDFTMLGGGIQVGCAPGDPASGREALQSAGFAAVDGFPGLICAINSAPDPCPAEFTGSYWSYWTAEPGGDWVAHQVGADTADPVPGSVEGWRYGDGTMPPAVAPAAVAQARSSVGAPPASLEEESGRNPAPLTSASVAGLGGAALLLGAAGVVARRRRAD